MINSIKYNVSYLSLSITSSSPTISLLDSITSYRCPHTPFKTQLGCPTRHLHHRPAVSTSWTPAWNGYCSSTYPSPPWVLCKVSSTSMSDNKHNPSWTTSSWRVVPSFNGVGRNSIGLQVRLDVGHEDIVRVAMIKAEFDIAVGEHVQKYSI